MRSSFRAALLLSVLLVVRAEGSRVQLDVLFFPDKTDQCGPSTLAGLLSYWGKPTDPRTLRQEMYTANLKGTLPMDLLEAAKTHGLNATMVEGTLEQVREELSAGRPVLAMLNVGFSKIPIGHYVVITGFDDEKSGVFMHSGGKPNQFMTFKKFEKKWKMADSWALFSKGQGTEERGQRKEDEPKR